MVKGACITMAEHAIRCFCSTGRTWHRALLPVLYDKTIWQNMAVGDPGPDGRHKLHGASSGSGLGLLARDWHGRNCAVSPSIARSHHQLPGLTLIA